MFFPYRSVFGHLFLHVSWHQFQIILVDPKTLHFATWCYNTIWKWVCFRVFHCKKPFTNPFIFSFYRNIYLFKCFWKKTILLYGSKLVLDGDTPIFFLLEIVYVFECLLFIRIFKPLVLIISLGPRWVILNLKLFEKLIIVMRFLNQGSCAWFDNVHPLLVGTFGDYSLTTVKIDIWDMF